MTEKEFLTNLKSELSSLNNVDIEDILSDYKEHFANGKKKTNRRANL